MRSREQALKPPTTVGMTEPRPDKRDKEIHSLVITRKSFKNNFKK